MSFETARPEDSGKEADHIIDEIFEAEALALRHSTNDPLIHRRIDAQLAARRSGCFGLVEEFAGDAAVARAHGMGRDEFFHSRMRPWEKDWVFEPWIKAALEKHGPRLSLGLIQIIF